MKPSKPYDNKEVLTKLYLEDKKSVLQIAKLFDTSAASITRRMKKFGIPGRPFSTKGLKTRLGAKLSEETKAKIRKGHLGKKLSPEHRAKVIKTLNHGRGSENPMWNGGVSISDGYIIIKVDNHPNANNGYVKYHRFVMEQALGRYLATNEHVHHIDGNKLNNSLDNLQMVTPEEHGRIHWDNAEAKKKQSEMMTRVREANPWSTRKSNK